MWNVFIFDNHGDKYSTTCKEQLGHVKLHSN